MAVYARGDQRAVEREGEAPDGVAVVAIGQQLRAGRAVENTHAVLAPQSDGDATPVGGERELGNASLERAETLDRATRQVDDSQAHFTGLVRRRVPSPGGEPAPVRRHRRGIELAGLPVADGQADDALEPNVG